jgi:hypothetical protein
VINLNHTVEEINVILRALDELPHRISRAIIDKIHGQAKPQVEALNEQAQAEQPAQPTDQPVA